MSHYFKYILLVTFLSVALVIVFLQFNSNQSISQLINGNEDLLGELNLKTNLQQLQTRIVTLESKVRGTVIEGVPIDSNHLKEEISSIKLSLQQIDTLQSYKMIAPLIIELNRLVQSKIQYNQEVLDTFTRNGKNAAEQLINTQYGRKLADSIRVVSVKVEDLHQLAVTELIQQADANGRKAKVLGSIMALMAAIVAVFTFGYVSYKVREQQQLIERLNSTEKKLREAARVKENFMANMSHEIRTPMNAVLGFTHLLEQKAMDPEGKEYVETIRKSGENLLTIINDILDLSKIEAGMMRIETAAFRIREVVQTVESMFRSKFAEKDIQYQTIIDPYLPEIVEGDAFRLTQILVNLVGNALKFTQKGLITVKVTNDGIQGNILYTGITVSDTGIGIESSQLKHIFERFQQAEDSTTRKYGGTGLGLSIVNELVLLQKGKMHVETAPGKGSAFRIILPYALNANNPTTNQQQIHETGSIDFNLKRVLVVEDNEINQTLIRHLMGKWKLPYDLSSNGRDAIQILKKKKYDLILMDIQMPEMDGYSTSTLIRTELKLETPIIAMTAHAMAGEREKCFLAGMNEYLSKPFKEEQLYQLIANFFGSNRLPNTTIANINQNDTNYHYLQLAYMREVSGGDSAYETTITQQFIEAFPEELRILEHAILADDFNAMRQIAHNLRTTVSVMGLNTVLQPILDQLEYQHPDQVQLTKLMAELKEISVHSVQEANQFLANNR